MGDMAGKAIVGVDLGGSKISAVLCDPLGDIKARDLSDTLAAEGPQAVIERIMAAIERLCAANEVAGIGIGAAGICDTASGVVTTSPNLPGWRDIPLRELVQRRFELPVCLQNDATAAAIGEHRFGGGKGIDDMLYVSVGTGIGGGIIIGGQPYCGASGGAGEIGHMTIDMDGPPCSCGKAGCWEALASGNALARDARQRIEAGEQSAILDFAGGQPEAVCGESILAAARQGDRLANELIASIGYYLGVGLANLIDIFNPQLILIGGGLSRMDSLLLEPAARVARERAFELPAGAVRIEAAHLGTDSAALGAVALVLQQPGI